MLRLVVCLAASLALLIGLAGVDANEVSQTKGVFEDKFRQLDVDLPTPNVYRAATGEPGPQYWQQSVDYDIKVRLDEDAKRIEASLTATYTNNSPHPLRYIWFQLDQNRFRDDSIARLTETARKNDETGEDEITYSSLRRLHAFDDVEHGFEITAVEDGRGAELAHTIVDTHMRIDLPRPLASGRSAEIVIGWAYNIINEPVVGGRGGYEHFQDSDTYQYFLAQWFPRATAFTDYEGWHNKAFLGRGEFALEFGDYRVEITVPSDHVVSSTGVLMNPAAVLTPTQRQRLDQARTADKPIFIVTPEEAADNAAEKASGEATWVFEAENVRDFAWASSRTYIWDAQGFDQDDGPDVMAMSFYPPEGEPLWSKYSTASVIHTMKVYSRFSFPYPYPTAQSVNTWARGGMEYPMITFNGYRPKVNKETGERTYSRSTKYNLIGVIIHEIGHIYFPMVVNSDERQWTWMDEGVNTFLEYLTELEWEEDYPAFRGHANLLDFITEYMVSEDQVPIMTQSDSILQFGPNAYSKPAAALVVLRETVMGREQFDFAFREYARRWAFKRPTPSDFFRTMEDASGVDLDWFWRGWFFSTDHVDVAVSDVRGYQISTGDPDVEYALQRLEREGQTPPPLTQVVNREEGRTPQVEVDPDLADFYTNNDRFTVSDKDRNDHSTFRSELKDWELATLDRAVAEKKHFTFIDFDNLGGLVTPLPLHVTYDDGSTEELMIPAEIWRRTPAAVTKMLVSDQAVTKVELDRDHRIADADETNNVFPQSIARTRLELFKRDEPERDLMADMLVELKSDADKEAAEAQETAPLAPPEASEDDEAGPESDADEREAPAD